MTLRERDAEWEPGCQFIKANEETARLHDHPWPLSVEMADAYHLLCRGGPRNHPAKFAGPHWNHEAMIYDPSADHSANADRRALLAAGDELHRLLAVSHKVAYRGNYNHGAGCPGCAALDRWTKVTEGTEP